MTLCYVMCTYSLHFSCYGMRSVMLQINECDYELMMTSCKLLVNICGLLSTYQWSCNVRLKQLITSSDRELSKLKSNTLGMDATIGSHHVQQLYSTCYNRFVTYLLVDNFSFR